MSWPASGHRRRRRPPRCRYRARSSRPPTPRRKLAEEQALSGELGILTRSLSYARAADLTALLTATVLSARGDVQIDARTNTLIIRDLPDRLQGAAALITTLDRPEP